MIREITACRICDSQQLATVLSLGDQVLTGVFPRTAHEKITRGPLDLVWCANCTLVQLRHSYDMNEMYGDNYGYRSGLNGSMIRHLEHKVRFLEWLASPSESDLVIDIGSNDATTLKAYRGAHRKVGVDPAGRKFGHFYPPDITLISEFFSAEAVERVIPGARAKIITSIAMFYDLERPADFVRDVAALLTDDGIWHFEQSYMPSMLRTNSYDTICHEHLEFYSFKVVKDLVERAGLRVVDVQMNSVNGGSFAVTACKAEGPYRSNTRVIEWMLRREQRMALSTREPYQEFERRVFAHRADLIALLDSLVAGGKRIVGYGASTKGNVLLQFCGITTKHISCIAEVNEDKFGCFTPGTNIPIVSEAEARALKPDYFLVLPWHFKPSIIEREAEFLAQGGHFIFPMPEIEII